MRKRSRLTGYYQEGTQKKVLFPKPIYVPKEYENTGKFIPSAVINLVDAWIKTDKQLKKYKEFVDVILNHMTNNGWSNDFTIEFWNMNEKELKVVNKMFKKRGK